MVITVPATITTERIAEVSETLRFLGDPTRLRILALMARSEICVCDLTERLDLSQPLISYHLGKLRSAGMVRARRDGNWVYYSLDPDMWDTTLAPIRAMLEMNDLPPEAAPGGRDDCKTQE
ncbi:MAG: ArsR/SmtB family transcription factor [Thermomicrobiales bacterium]|jgi:ArsR family transcriptional regulator